MDKATLIISADKFKILPKIWKEKKLGKAAKWVR